MPVSAESALTGASPEGRRFDWFPTKLPAKLGAVIVVATALDLAGLLPVSIAGVEPHPFWFAVVLAALTHGTLAGLAIALLATLGHLATASFAFVPGQDFYAWQLALWREPALWLLAGASIGELRRRHDGIVAELRGTAEEARRQREAAGAQAERLRAHIAGLERRIATGDDRLAALCDLAADGQRDPQRRAEAIRRAGERVLGASAITIVLPGSAQDARTRALVETLAREGRPLTAETPADAERLAGSAAVAAPFASGGGGLDAAILGCDFDPELLGGEAVRLAFALAACASPPSAGADRGRDEPPATGGVG